MPDISQTIGYSIATLALTFGICFGCGVASWILGRVVNGPLLRGFRWLYGTLTFSFGYLFLAELLTLLGETEWFYAVPQRPLIFRTVILLGVLRSVRAFRQEDKRRG